MTERKVLAGPLDERRVQGRRSRWSLTAGPFCLAAILGISAVSLAAAGCGGSDEGTTASSTTTTGSSGSVIEIGPASGPPGTEIAWTWSDTSCADTSNKYPTLNVGGPNGKEVAGEKTKELSGTLTVPKDAVPGSYTFSIYCSVVGTASSGGQIGVSLDLQDDADLGFEVTGA